MATGSADIVSSTERIPEYTKDFRKRGVEIVDSICPETVRQTLKKTA